MAECQINTNPFVSMATRCNVMMMSDSVSRRDSCYHGNSDDDDDSAVDASGVNDGKTNNGQWVRLSKSLLLQLVERICQLSFQQVETRGQRCQTDETQPTVDEADNLPSPVVAPTDTFSTSEVCKNRDIVGDVIGDDECCTASQCCGVETPSNADCIFAKPNSRVKSSVSKKRRPLRASVQNVRSTSMKTADDIISWNKDRRRLTAIDDDNSAKIAAKENTQSPGGAVMTDAAVNRSCSLVRRRHRLSNANVMRRRRQRSRRRSHLSRRHSPIGEMGNQQHDDNNSTNQHGLLKRQKQSWLALNKSLVLCALDRALSVEDIKQSNDAKSDSASVGSTRVAKSIWNPAISLSRYETKAAAPVAEAVQQQPTGCHVLPMGMWPSTENPAVVMNPLWIASSQGLVACSQPVADTRGLGASCANSSLLCRLLGFDANPIGGIENVSLKNGDTSTSQNECASAAADVTIQSEMKDNRLYHRQLGDCEQSRNDETSSKSRTRTFSSVDESRILSPTKTQRHMTSLPTAVVDDGITAPLDYRTATSRSSKTSVLKPGCIGNKWIVLNKGDVSNLVESLVNTMIASGAPGERRRELLVRSPGDSSDRISTSEPRKWKSHLLQRLRTETQ